MGGGVIQFQLVSTDGVQRNERRVLKRFYSMWSYFTDAVTTTSVVQGYLVTTETDGYMRIIEKKITKSDICDFVCTISMHKSGLYTSMINVCITIILSTTV